MSVLKQPQLLISNLNACLLYLPHFAANDKRLRCLFQIQSVAEKGPVILGEATAELMDETQFSGRGKRISLAVLDLLF